MFNAEKYEKKWTDILEHKDVPKIDDNYRRSVTTIVLEQQEKALNEEREQLKEYSPEPGNVSGGVAKWDPVLISLVRRTTPNLMAFDVAGVQPMSGPTGLAFALRARYGKGQEGTEALFNEADTAFSGTGSHAEDSSSLDVGHSVGTGMATADAELLNTDGGYGPHGIMNEMSFSIEKATVTAKSRALKAGYTVELAQDLKAIHGLDAETELANILSTEILAEKNRELVRTINQKAILGAQGTTVDGTFDLAVDADGRWSAERFKGLIVQIEKESNQIAKATRRGKGNIVIVSSDVATALAASNMLQYSPEMSTRLNVDDTGTTFAGILNGRIKVYVDPYATVDYATVGYRGPNPYDAGIFYCPYVPLTLMRATGEEDFQPRIAFKTRYGMIANPFALEYSGGNATSELGSNRANPYFRIFKVDNILTPALGS